ncbi:hypothetical protein SAMN05444166_0056 [Singulisphaera sp. GP187]|uniref:hypothetical protein n=1 Tax=Singulisphaera sp. GP187 TaxID=1882752 RepID=UPI000929E020|nr:hypothetical protein [Singulisphaera sp. GP187]SIN68105.1 hypothetical protein SAMN05444166_0056 [Singulisphaera sp. GP187]
MTGKGVTLGKLMKITALVALDLAILRAVSSGAGLLLSPVVWFPLAALNYVVVWKIILGRPFQAFHYTFFVVYITSYIALGISSDGLSLHIVGTLVRWYRGMTGDQRGSILFNELVFIAEMWATCFLSILPAWATGLLAAQFERRRSWGIAAFIRGALIGYGVAMLAGVFYIPPTHTAAWYVRFVGLYVACPILGSLLGLSWGRSITPERRNTDPTVDLDAAGAIDRLADSSVADTSGL